MSGPKQIRYFAVALGAALVGALAILLRHELGESKPYKIVSHPLQSALAASSVWLPVLLVVVGVLAALVVARRSAVAAPFAAATVAVAVALAGFAGLMSIWGPAVPAAGDFGRAAVWSAFRHFIATQGVGALVAGIVASVVVGLLRGRLRDAV